MKARDGLNRSMVVSLGFRPDQWVKWSAIIDERASVGCFALNGCLFVVTNCPRWPEHQYCRCQLHPVSAPDARADAILEKFNSYLFAEKGIRQGKASLFTRWGYTIDDSELLSAIYAKQAKDKYQNGDYKLGSLNQYGQRVTIFIELMDLDGTTRTVKSGWMVEPQGYIRLNTPFAG